MIRKSDIDRLRGLFAKRLIATMDMLKKTVGTVADLTVFRKLRELDYCTSYSHVDVSTRSESSRSLMRTACVGFGPSAFQVEGHSSPRPKDW